MRYEAETLASLRADKVRLEQDLRAAHARLLEANQRAALAEHSAREAWRFAQITLRTRRAPGTART